MIICEPQCRGHEHVEFNAAFLAVVSAASANRPLLFLAEEEHMRLVEARLAEKSIGGIECRSITVPQRALLNHQRFGADYRLVRSVYNRAGEMETDSVIFTSVNSSLLISIKSLLHTFKRISCIVVLHAILESVAKRRPALKPLVLRSYIELPFWFRIALLYGNTGNIGYIVLGEPIYRHLCDKFPKLEQSTTSIDIPYFYNEPGEFKPFRDGIVRFGSLGVASRSKGSDLFFSIADEVTAEAAKSAEFIHIGPVDRKLKVPDSVKLAKDKGFLDRAEYDAHAGSIDYALLCHRPSSYRLTASASLFDAFSHLKPVVALKSPFFEHYFDLMGDIGYLCDNPEALRETVKKIVFEPPKARYAAQRENILKGRERLSIAELGSKIELFPLAKKETKGR